MYLATVFEYICSSESRSCDAIAIAEQPQRANGGHISPILRSRGLCALLRCSELWVRSRRFSRPLKDAHATYTYTLW